MLTTITATVWRVIKVEITRNVDAFGLAQYEISVTTVIAPATPITTPTCHHAAYALPNTHARKERSTAFQQLRIGIWASRSGRWIATRSSKVVSTYSSSRHIDDADSSAAMPNCSIILVCTTTITTITTITTNTNALLSHLGGIQGEWQECGEETDRLEEMEESPRHDEHVATPRHQFTSIRSDTQHQVHYIHCQYHRHLN